MIIDVGEENWFSACEVLEDDRLGLPGTGGYDDISQLVGNMTLAQILEGFEKSSAGLNPKIKKIIKDYSKKPPRILKR